MLSAFLFRTSDPRGLVLWCAVGFVAGIGLFIYGFRLLQRRRLILDTPFSKIRSASIGMVEVSGLAVGPYTMVAPITGRPCYYYRTLIWELKQQGKNKNWVKVAGECMHLPFFVDDNTGHMLVDPRGADLDLHHDFEQEFCDSFFTLKGPAPDSVRSFLSRHGVSTTNRIKVEECCIKPKNALFILGTLGENPGLEVSPQPIRDAETITSFTPQGFSLSIHALSFSSSGSENNFEPGSPAQQMATQSDMRSHEVIRLSPGSGATTTADMTQQQKVAAALRKAGISNPAAWAVAGAQNIEVSPAAATSGVQVLNETGEENMQPNGFDPHPPIVLMKGTNNKTFLISWRSQQEVARTLGWKCTLMIWGGPLLALFSLYVLNSVWPLL
jgi:hypothetical protein